MKIPSQANMLCGVAGIHHIFRWTEWSFSGPLVLQYQATTPLTPLDDAHQEGLLFCGAAA